MSAEAKCGCQSCAVRALTGPAVVITVGVLLLLHQVSGGRFYFGNTWPVILMVIGILHLASSMASHVGHVAAAPPVIPPTVPPVPPTQGMGSPQSSFPAQGQ